MRSRLPSQITLYDLPTPVVLISATGESVACNSAAQELAQTLQLPDYTSLVPPDFIGDITSGHLVNTEGLFADALYPNAQTYRWQVIALQDQSLVLQAYNLTDREHYRAILENSVDGVYQTNRDGKLVYANQALADTFGYQDTQHMRDSIKHLARDLYHNAEDRAHFLNQLDLCGEVRSMELQMKRLDGSLAWIRLNGRALKNDQGVTQSVVGTVYDITAHKAAQSALVAAEEKFRSIFENSLAGLHQSTLNGQYLNVNPALARILGFSSPKECLDNIQHIGKQVYVRPHEWLKAMSRLRKEGFFTLNEVEIYTRDGEKRWISVSNRLIPASKEMPEHIEGSIIDITHSKQSQERIQYLAHFDSLTGLPNRISFHHELEKLVQEVDQSTLDALALIILDLDNFKGINDSQGHSTGDKLLVETAARLQGFFANRAQIFRLGGDEFAITLSNMTDRAYIAAELDALLKLLTVPVELDGYEINCTGSIGIALYPEARDVIQEGDVQQQLFRYADLALYRSKARGRNRYTFFAIEMQLEVLKEQQIERELRTAIRNNELCLYLQPLLRAEDEQMTGAEVLVRWQHPERGLISPAEFIPIAEKTGLISKLDDWVLMHTVQQIQHWSESGIDALPLSVNISAHRLNKADFADYVQYLLQTSQIPAESLCLEITEQSMITSFKNVRAALNQIRNLGVRIALDDFGTGYSSLSYLKQLPVDKLKIDRSFVMNMHEDPQDQAIIKTVIDLGQGLGIRITAEGIERRVQAQILHELGVDEFQGFLFSRPLPLAQFEKLYLE